MKREYVQRKIQQYKSRKQIVVNSSQSLKGLRLHRNIHPLLRWLLKVKSKVCGLTYEIIDNKFSEYSNETVVYAVTHIGKYDFEMVTEVLPMVSYVFAGDWEMAYGTVDDYFLRANGVIYVDTEDKEDRINSAKLMVKTLKEGMSVMIFPEGIWNLSESLPMQKIYGGAIQTAQEAEVPIVPIAIEQRGKHFYINVGEKMDVTKLDKEVGVQMLRDTLATLKWELWEQLSMERRIDVPENWYEEFVAERLAECPYITREVVEGRVYRDKVDRELASIRNDIEQLKGRYYDIC